MKYSLFTEVILARDITEAGLKAGDLVRVVDHHPATGGEDGYSVEVFNASGETIVVSVVPESAVEALRGDQSICVRPIEGTA